MRGARYAIVMDEATLRELREEAARADEAYGLPNLLAELQYIHPSKIRIERPPTEKRRYASQEARVA